MTMIRFISKKFTEVGVEKVNAVGAQGKDYRYENSKKEAKYLNREVVGF